MGGGGGAPDSEKSTEYPGPGGCRIAKEGIEQSEGRRALGTAQGSQQSTELTEGHRAFRNVLSAYHAGGRRMDRMAQTTKRTPNIQGEGISSDHESA